MDPFKGPYVKAPCGEASYGKAPYGEASYGKALYEIQESLREATGRDFTRIEALLPFKGPFPLTGPLRADRLTGRPLTGRLLTGDTFNYKKAYGKLRGGTLPESGGNFRLCAVDQKRPSFPRVGPFGPVLTGRAGVLYGAGSLHREERPLITGKLTGSCGEGLYQNWAGISASAP